MSLWCGACRKEIFEGFGILYRMDVVDGVPRRDTKDKEYVPPNSAVCDRCWAAVPRGLHHEDLDGAVAQHRGVPVVFGYAVADSSSSIWGSKQWCDIESADSYVFLRLDTVERYLPLVLPIIVEMDAASKAESRAERARS